MDNYGGKVELRQLGLIRFVYYISGDAIGFELKFGKIGFELEFLEIVSRKLISDIKSLFNKKKYKS